METLLDNAIVLHGRRARRTARHYGPGYDYGRRTPTPGEPIPPWLDEVRLRVAPFARITPDKLEEALVQHYPKGSNSNGGSACSRDDCRAPPPLTLSESLPDWY